MHLKFNRQCLILDYPCLPSWQSRKGQEGMGLPHHVLQGWAGGQWLSSLPTWDTKTRGKGRTLSWGGSSSSSSWKAIAQPIANTKEAMIRKPGIQWEAEKQQQWVKGRGQGHCEGQALSSTCLLEPGTFIPAALALFDNGVDSICDFLGINWKTNLWLKKGLHEHNHLICY